MELLIVGKQLNVNDLNSDTDLLINIELKDLKILITNLKQKSINENKKFFIIDTNKIFIIFIDKNASIKKVSDIIKFQNSYSISECSSIVNKLKNYDFGKKYIKTSYLKNILKKLN